jgi:hypothetical protein
MKVKLHTFKTSAMNGDKVVASSTSCFTPEERNPITHPLNIRQEGPRVGLNEMAKRRIPTAVFIL